jgi:hypothetical protein
LAARPAEAGRGWLSDPWRETPSRHDTRTGLAEFKNASCVGPTQFGIRAVPGEKATLENDPRAGRAKAQTELIKEHNAAEMEAFRLAIQAGQMQADINKVEASHQCVFVAG